MERILVKNWKGLGKKQNKDSRKESEVYLKQELNGKLETVDPNVFSEPVVTRTQIEVMSRETNTGPNNEETNNSLTHEESIVLSDTFFIDLNSDSEETGQISDCYYCEKKRLVPRRQY